jgi:hypothetical protein
MSCRDAADASQPQRCRRCFTGAIYLITACHAISLSMPPFRADYDAATVFAAAADAS